MSCQIYNFPVLVIQKEFTIKKNEFVPVIVQYLTISVPVITIFLPDFTTLSIPGVVPLQIIIKCIVIILNLMKMKTNSGKKDNKTPDSEFTPGYPTYPASEDIYSKETGEPYTEAEESSLNMGLDIPGAELDDTNELIGEEDEENNYYSLGDDDNIDRGENSGER